jgi:NAD(P)H-dependent FMN reductase
MKTVVACYSWKGHTEKVAREVARILDADVVRIEPAADPGSGMGGKAMKALFGRRDAIRPCLTDLADVGHLVIATPVWSHKIPPYTREYLGLLTNCAGKKFSVLAEMGGSGAESAVAIVRKILEKKGMIFVASVSTVEKDVDAGTFGDAVAAFADRIRSG